MLPCTLLLLITSAALGQELFIIPKWKRDDLRTMYITRTQTITAVNAEGERMDTIIPYNTSAKVRVYDITPEVVMISIDHENMVLPMLKPYFETGFPSEVEPFRRMIIRYEVDRDSGAPRLLNATDLREFVKRAADHCLRALRKKDAAIAQQVEASLQPLLHRFENESMIESSIDQQVGFLFEAFGKGLAQGSPVEFADMFFAPFTQADSAHINTTYTLMSRSDDQAELKIVKKLADRPVPVKKTASSPTPTDRSVGIETWQQQQLITLDLRTTWPLKVTTTSRMEITNGISASEETTVQFR